MPDGDLPVPVENDSPASGGVAYGHFVVLRRADGELWKLGAGAMGMTYRAFDTGLKIEVALKVIAALLVGEEEVRRRFQREARAAARIRHPNVASVVHLGEQAGEFFYAMEFIAGRSLQQFLYEAAGPLPPVVALALAAQAPAALNAAHKRGVLHRDLKPANLMLLEGDALDHEDERTAAAGGRQLKVIDFGLARSFGAEGLDDSRITRTEAGFIGTAAYASSEQCASDRKLDGRSDLYSLGVILWQMLTGRLPFTGNWQQVIAKHQYQEPPLNHLAGLAAPVADLVTGLLVEDPAARRPQSASELRATLDALWREASSHERDPVPEPVKIPGITGAADAPPPITTITPAIGTTGHQLGREIGVGNGGHLFLAADNRQVTMLSPPTPPVLVLPDRPRRDSAWKAGAFAVVVLMGGVLALAGYFGRFGPVPASASSLAPSPPPPMVLSTPQPVLPSPTLAPVIATTPEPTLAGPAAGQDFRNAAGAEMVWIRPGSFTMGSPESEEGRYDDEKPHQVKLTRGYWLGKYPVTQGLYKDVTGENPSDFVNAGLEAPVETVGWDEAKAFCAKLTENERRAGRLPVGFAYRLPTEAQWEYACRAGTSGTVYSVDARTLWKIVDNKAAALDSIAWYAGNSNQTTHPVGQKQQNPWGLFDTIGNVYQWCDDGYSDYQTGIATDPTGLATGLLRVIRGGGWSGNARSCRAATRDYGRPGKRSAGVGFRAALVPSSQ